MNFYQTEQATNYLDKLTGCSAVNMNDYVDTIYFYNALASNIANTYQVLGTYQMS